MGEKILVIGSAGFIGSHLTRMLADRGHEVVGLDLRSPAENFGCQRFVQGSLLDHAALSQCLEGVGTVFHLAAIHADVGHEPSEYWETNETGTLHLATAMDKQGVHRLLFVSSMAVYGDRDDEPSEVSETRPTSIYGASKAAAEKVVQQWVANDSRNAAMIVRPSVVYGERHVANVRTLIRQIHSGWFFEFGSGANVKATAYVENLTAALFFCLERMAPGLEVYNYADKPDLTSHEIVVAISRFLGRQHPPQRLPFWLGLIAAAPFDVVAKCLRKPLPISMARVRKLARPTPISAEKIRAAGFQQPIPSEVGLRRMVDDYLHRSR